MTSAISALSAREMEVARLVCDAKTNREIACALGITADTVKQHIGNVFRKIGARNRVALVKIFLNADAAEGRYK